MKPQGQTPVIFPGKVDHHIRKNHKLVGNWWDDIGFCNKKADRQKSKKDIDQELIDELNREFDKIIENSNIDRFR